MKAIPAAASYRWLFWMLATFGLVSDQASKYVIFSGLYHGGAGGHRVIAGVLDIAVATFRPHCGGHEKFQGLRTLGGRDFGRTSTEGTLRIGQGKKLIFGRVSVLAALFIVGWSMRSGKSRLVFVRCFGIDPGRHARQPL